MKGLAAIKRAACCSVQGRRRRFFRPQRRETSLGAEDSGRSGLNRRLSETKLVLGLGPRDRASLAQQITQTGLIPVTDMNVNVWV